MRSRKVGHRAIHDIRAVGGGAYGLEREGQEYHLVVARRHRQRVRPTLIVQEGRDGRVDRGDLVAEVSRPDNREVDRELAEPGRHRVGGDTSDEGGAKVVLYLR